MGLRMTKSEFKRCFVLAEQGNVISDLEEAQQAYVALCGFGLEPKTATAKQVAHVINYQSMQFNGIRDSAMLEDCYHAMLRNVTLLD